MPLDTHGNPLPQEEAEEVLQTAMRLEFPPEEGFVEQYESPSEDGDGEERRRDEEGGRTKRTGVVLPLPHESQ